MTRTPTSAHDRVSPSLIRRLNTIYDRYHLPEYLRLDPLLCVRKFSDPAAREIAGFIAASLSYGRVEQIIRSVTSLFCVLGNDPREAIMHTGFREKCRMLKTFKHRFNDGIDMARLLEAIRNIIAESGSLESLFSRHFQDGDGTMRPAMAGFASSLRRAAPSSTGSSRSFSHLLPCPSAGSACKRLNMYFRWMVRKDDGIDLGVWTQTDPSILIVPLDVHLARIARRLRMTGRTTPDWAMAEEITATLKKVDPCDPVKYDFSLCRYGMMELREGQPE